MDNTYRTRKTLGDRVFAENVASQLWNRLPLEIRQCQSLNTSKVLLKTHLFKLTHISFLLFSENCKLLLQLLLFRLAIYYFKILMLCNAHSIISLSHVRLPNIRNKHYYHYYYFW